MPTKVEQLTLLRRDVYNAEKEDKIALYYSNAAQLRKDQTAMQLEIAHIALRELEEEMKEKNA